MTAIREFLGAVHEQRRQQEGEDAIAARGQLAAQITTQLREHLPEVSPQEAANVLAVTAAFLSPLVGLGLTADGVVDVIAFMADDLCPDTTGETETR